MTQPVEDNDLRAARVERDVLAGNLDEAATGFLAWAKAREEVEAGGSSAEEERHDWALTVWMSEVLRVRHPEAFVELALRLVAVAQTEEDLKRATFRGVFAVVEDREADTLDLVRRRLEETPQGRRVWAALQVGEWV